MRLLRFVVLLFRCLVAWLPMVTSSTLTVKITQGELRGEVLSSVQGKTYLSFKGIPYAAPPLGELRFKPPQPPESWEGVRNALKEGPHCPQAQGHGHYANIAHEDCLFLNVYTPQLPSSGSTALPVMVWIHDGGFTHGSGDSVVYGPDYLVDAGVILVTLNYRLNIFGENVDINLPVLLCSKLIDRRLLHILNAGRKELRVMCTEGFLCLDNDEVPGNMGLKDQVAALKWVQGNIAAFGGDPGNVTIFGASAGGASVLLHMLSPLSEGLFHRAISQSGSPLNPWAMSFTNKERAFQVGEKLDCKTNDSAELLACLKEANASSLVAATLALIPPEENVMFLKSPFCPTVEPEAEGSFISEHPAVAMSEGRFQQVPCVIGSTACEGSLGTLGSSSPSWAIALNTRFEKQLPEVPIPAQEVAAKVKEFYFNNEPISKGNMDNFIDFYTDFWFATGIYDSAMKMAARSQQPVFFYVFYFDGALGHLKRLVNAPELIGPAHVDDLGYIFHSSVNPPDVSSDSAEVRTLHRMVKLWTNFAKTGNPTPAEDDEISAEWRPLEKNETCFYSIDSQLSMDCNLNTERLKFWERMYQEKH